MLMDYELHTVVNSKIAQLINEAKDNEVAVDLDMILTQTDKYENTEYETIIIGIGFSKGLKTDQYYFNAINDENNENFKLADKCFNEPVTYYEHVGNSFYGHITYRIKVDTMSRKITVYEVSYAYKYNQGLEPHYKVLENIDLKPSKFSKKIKRTVVA